MYLLFLMITEHRNILCGSDLVYVMFVQDLFVLTVLYGSFGKTYRLRLHFCIIILEGHREGCGNLIKTVLCKQVLLRVLKINGMTPCFAQS